jgi:hypothetical protein
MHYDLLDLYRRASEWGMALSAARQEESHAL